MRLSLRVGIILTVAALVYLGVVATTVEAAPPLQQPTPAPSTAPSTGPLTDAQCLDCHTKPDLFKRLPSGEDMYLTIDGAAFGTSKHAATGCVKCHSDIKAFPHPDRTYKNLREVTFGYTEATCKNCHDKEAAKQADSIHNQLHLQGNQNTATCADCHNPHYTVKPGEPRSRIPNICVKCHTTVVNDYQQSVHGGELKANNPDVPSCITCHGVHNIADPRTTKFLLNSPELCASCHTDKSRMTKYGLNTEVYNTYVSDFHGTTVTMFEQRSPDQLPNKPLCIDCHGIHNIASTKDPQKGLQVKENMLTACKKCHPTANTSFSSAWLSHYQPSLEHNPLVFYVNLFYQFFIPMVLGGMAVFVVVDAGNKIYKRLRGKKA